MLKLYEVQDLTNKTTNKKINEHITRSKLLVTMSNTNWLLKYILLPGEANKSSAQSYVVFLTVCIFYYSKFFKVRRTFIYADLMDLSHFVY